MKINKIIYLFAALSLIFACSPKTDYDVCVYGESASGVVAAIQAARMDKTVVLVSKNDHVGGLATSGLTATDINKHLTIGGIAAEFYGHIWDYYLQEDVWKNQTRDEFLESTLKRTFRGRNEAREIQWVYESGVAEKIMKDMLAEAGVTVLYNTQLVENDGAVVKSRGKIREIFFEDGNSLSAKMFIDASYTGDLMAAAGVSYIVGRESNATYNETYAGIRVAYEPERDLSFISPYDKEGKLLPYVDAELWGEQGEGDGRTQAYCYRVTLTDDPQNMIPVVCPENYNPLWYEIVLGQILNNPEIELKNVITFTPMPNRKTDTNHLDFFGASFPYPEASYAERAELEQLHKDYAVGMLWFLGNDPRVPEHLRAEMLRWGFPKDEFVENGNFPYQIYVREARRMIGEYVMTEHNILTENRDSVVDPIGMGAYPLDCHFVSRVVDSEGKLRAEGTMYKPLTPYGISYRSLVPKREECTNLFVTVCLSSSHVAYASIRMEPNYMVLGQSAATAAGLAIDNRQDVQDVDYETLKARLLEDGQILEYQIKKK